MRLFLVIVVNLVCIAGFVYGQLQLIGVGARRGTLPSSFRNRLLDGSSSVVTQTSSGALNLISFRFPAVVPFANISIPGSNLQFFLGNVADIFKPPELLGKVLNFPNPFPFDEGTTIGYRLNKIMPIDLYVYDMMAELVLHKSISAGDEGAAEKYNKIPFNRNSLDGLSLSAGVYFVYVVTDGEILGRGKMAVIP